MSSTVERRIRLAMIEYELRPVRVMVLKDVGVIEVDGARYELRKGTEVEIPRWLARILSREGMVEPLENPMTLDDLARFHFMVTEAKSLNDTPQLPPDFYPRLVEYLERLEEELRRNPSPTLLEEKSKAEFYTDEIVSRRIWVIVQLLRTPAAKAEVYERLTPEEKLLYDLLHDIIEAWRRAILGTRSR